MDNSRKRGLCYVPKTRDISPSLSVEENLAAGLKGRPHAAVDEVYALYPRLAARRRNGGAQLSGGEQQVREGPTCADRVLILDHGHVVHEGRASELREDHATVDRHIGMVVH
jgi:ABC-type branched-subunit amino acid transport system ATPase component